ncbi:MAG: hypothetical protein JXK05_13845 [Campylobacterales bacterium]|nr:hypothetical protein [Campylobacterales bacterium]
MAKKEFLKNLEQVKKSAAMTEQVTKSTKQEKMKKLISLPVEWDEKIRAFHGGTVNAYILIAIQERMQRDGLI